MHPDEIKQLLRRYHLTPLKQLGQHFLIEECALEKIVSFAKITKNDTIIEIGAGLGVLTERLANTAKNVIAIEIDKGFAVLLRERFGHTPSVTIVAKDILAFTPPQGELYKIVGNLPYHISSAILEKFLKKEATKPELMVVTVQKEFAQRMVAAPPSMNRLALLAQYHGTPTIVALFPPHYFWPQPLVTSCLVTIEIQTKFPLSKSREARLWDITKKAFSCPRKMLKHTFPPLAQTRYGTLRPSELSLEDWQKCISLNH